MGTSLEQAYICVARLQQGRQLKTIQRQQWDLLFAGLAASPWALQQHPKRCSMLGQELIADVRFMKHIFRAD